MDHCGGVGDVIGKMDHCVGETPTPPVMDHCRGVGLGVWGCNPQDGSLWGKGV